MSAEKQLSNERIANTLKITGGHVYDAAKRLKVSPSMIYRRIKEEPDLQTIIDEERYALVDDAEKGLKDLIKEKNPTAIIFALKTQGASRGYVEKHEITGKDGVSITLIEIVRRDDKAAKDD